MGGLLLRILGGGVGPSSLTPDSTSDQKCHYSRPLSDPASEIHTRFQAWPLRNYVIIRLD